MIDEFLVGFAAGHHSLERKMDQLFAVFKHVTRKFDQEWVGFLKGQYIVHRIFRKGGLINKFLNHPALAAGINDYGYQFSDESFIRVNTSMLVTAKDILKKELVLNGYDGLFHIEPYEEVQGELDKLNAFMAMILPDINAGRKPDIEAMAKKAGVDIETARDLVKNVLGKLDDMDPI